MPPGLQAAQAVHAALKFPLPRPVDPEMNLVLLQVPDEAELQVWASRLAASPDGPSFVCWHEPDLDNQMTAIASTPSPHFSSLPLLLREAVTA